MADKQVTETVTTEKKVRVTDDSEIILQRAKGFWDKFSKPIIYIGSTIILVSGGWMLYKKFVKEPNEAKSAEQIFPAEKIFDKMTQTGFNKDSINLVLNGGNGALGVLKIASNYSGTDNGNRANYIAGACYLQNKDFANAIKYLKEFSTPATQVQTAAYLMLGDANAELNKNDEALDYYKKAATVNEKDEFMTSESLFKAGSFADYTGKTKDAIDLFKKLKNEYPKTMHAPEMDKYLAKLGVLN
jgi:tetratricopeptide (TPR) repeat protein